MKFDTQPRIRFTALASKADLEMQQKVKSCDSIKFLLTTREPESKQMLDPLSRHGRNGNALAA